MQSNQNFDDNISSYKKQLMNFYENNIKPQTPTTTENNQTNYNQNTTLSPDALFDLYKKNHPALGKLLVKTFTARRTFPVEGAVVEVAKVFPTGKYIISKTLTNESGMTDILLLPTARKPLSLAPGDPEPYATYTVTVSHPNFVTTRITDVPVFDETTSVQTVDLIPPSASPTGNEIIEYTAYKPNL